jgi:uncharacterized membrane protein
LCLNSAVIRRWEIPAALFASLFVLGPVAVWADEGWRVVVAIASIAVIIETVLAFFFRRSLRKALLLLRVLTTATILCASVLRVGLAADRGASPSPLLVIAAATAVVAVLIAEWRAWQESDNDRRLAVACFTQAAVVAASAVTVIANLEMAL